MIHNQLELPETLVKKVVNENFGEGSEMAKFIIHNLISIFESTASSAAMFRATYAICEIKDNPEEAKICSLGLSNIAQSTKMATPVILAAEQLVQNKRNPNAKSLYFAMLMKGA